MQRLESDELGGPDAPDAPDAPDGPDGPDAPDAPDAPDGPDGPDAPDEPVGTAGSGLLGGIPRRRTPCSSSPVVPPLSPPAGDGTSAPSRPTPWRRLARLLPTPTGTPFTFWYGCVLVVTSVYAEYGDPATVSALLRGFSTDVAHLASTPLLVLVASALWVAGGPTSAYAVGFVLVLTALERRIGAWRTAAVFLGGHVAATLATEIPVGLSVMAGQLPETSLHRLDYGISFGLLTCVGALAGLLTPMARTVLVGWVSAVLLGDLLAYEDPLTDWGHPLALLAGVLSMPAVRRWARVRQGALGS
ncbi:rhomboid-like protein [Streptomyces sp. NPDC001970]